MITRQKLFVCVLLALMVAVIVVLIIKTYGLGSGLIISVLFVLISSALFIALLRD